MDDTLDRVDLLTQRLNETEPLSKAERKRLYAAFSRQVFSRMTDEGISWGEASGFGSLYVSDYEDFRGKIKRTDQNLDWQCDTVGRFLSHHLETGDVVPPYFPRRIAILLSKAKEKERERAFLEAWCRHFGAAGWFGDRLRKLKLKLDKSKALK